MKHNRPTLPLPVVTGENRQIPNWTAGTPMPNSMRARHYNPGFVMPVLQTGQAVRSEVLEYGMQMMLAAVVSSRNGCRYCLCSSLKALNGDGSADSLVRALQADIASSGFGQKEKSVLLLAERLTQHPSSAGDLVQGALDAGWSHEQVAQVIFFVSYMNMMNRIAQAFDLPPDDSHPYDPDAALPVLRCGQ